MSFVILARIIKPHGIKGDVVIRVFCSEPLEHYLPLKDTEGEEYPLTGLRPTGADTVVAHIPGVETRTQAETLRGRDLGVNRDRLPSLEEGAFYVHDLIGLSVLDATTRETIGKLTYVHDFGAGAVLEIKTPQGQLMHAPFQAVQEITPTTLTLDGRWVI